MQVFRIEKESYCSEFPPTGSLFSDGRWHKKGMWIVYTSENISLAKLEVLANTVVFPKNRVLRIIEIQDQAPVYHILEVDLPKDWMNIPYPASLAEIIRQLILQAKYVALSVPSTQSPRERNYLLLPTHPEFNKFVYESEVTSIGFDIRLV